MGKIPEFFKVLIGDFKEHLCLPPDFVRYISTEVLQCALIRADDEKAWSVQLLRTNTDVMFGVGWKEFVECYKLQLGEFLVFRYHGHLQFRVKIFSITGLERPCVTAVESLKTSTVTNQELDACGARSLFSSKCNSKAFLRRQNMRKKISSVQKEPLDMERIPAKRSACGLQSPCSYKKRKTDDGDNLSTSDGCKPKRCPVDSSKLSNPSFKVVLEKKSINEIRTPYVPLLFYQTHLKDKKYTNLCYANDHGAKTMSMVRLYWRPRGGCVMSAGFTKFCHANNLTPGDECIFELNSERSGFTVHSNKAKTLA